MSNYYIEYIKYLISEKNTYPEYQFILKKFNKTEFSENKKADKLINEILEDEIDKRTRSLIMCISTRVKEEALKEEHAVEEIIRKVKSFFKNKKIEDHETLALYLAIFGIDNIEKISDNDTENRRAALSEVKELILEMQTYPRCQVKIHEENLLKLTESYIRNNIYHIYYHECDFKPTQLYIDAVSILFPEISDKLRTTYRGYNKYMEQAKMCLEQAYKIKKGILKSF